MSWIEVANHATDFQLGTFPVGWTYAYRPDTNSTGTNFSLNDWTNFTMTDATRWIGPDAFSTPFVAVDRCHPGQFLARGTVLVAWTVQVDGVYKINCDWTRMINQGDVFVYSFKNTEVLTTANLLGLQNHSFETEESCLAGDLLISAVDRNKSYNSDSTNFAFSIARYVSPNTRRRRYTGGYGL